MPLWHDYIVNESCNSYLQYLQTQPQTSAAVAIAQYLQHAVDDHQGPPPAFSANELQGLDHAALCALINRYSLGYGNPYGTEEGGLYRPGLMVVGTEHAYNVTPNDPAALMKLAVEACGLSALWKRNANIQEIASLAANPAWAQMAHQFFRNPTYHFGRRPAGHTWRKAGYTVCGLNSMEATEQAFQRMYMIEMSAHPAAQAHNGHPPGPEQLIFLQELFERCGQLENGRLPIGTVWFHGGMHNPALAPAREELICSFFGVMKLPERHTENVNGQSIWFYQHGEKRALVTHALSHYVVNAYWDRVRDLIG